MSLKSALEARGVTTRTLELAVSNTEKVLATVILNASKNLTNAQAMKGNASALAGDLEVLRSALAEFNEAEKVTRKPRANKVEVNEISGEQVG